VNGDGNGKNIELNGKWWFFQLAMFDYRRVIARFKKNLPGVLTQEML
jgi:hypothetical protein